MKMKKLFSAICASALLLTSFAAFIPLTTKTEAAEAMKSGGGDRS